MYKAILFAPDGDYVTDHKSTTIQGVVDKISDQGSKWFFYPYAFVIVDRGSVTHRQRFVDIPEEFFDWKNATVGTFIRRARMGHFQKA